VTKAVTKSLPNLRNLEQGSFSIFLDVKWPEKVPAEWRWLLALRVCERQGAGGMLI
jgi:hypothetical protein